MANVDHLAKLRKGARVWNQWRQDNPKVIPDLAKSRLVGAMLSRFDLRDAVMSNATLDKGFLRYANLIGAQLGGASLKYADCHGADCRGISLRGAAMDGAKVNGANLRTAKLDNASLFKANLEECILERADMRGVKLTSADLRRANLTGADLSSARLDNADLSHANFFQANLRHADLRRSNSRYADFRLAILHLSVFDHADITDSRLWESQRTGWSIKGIACERVFWGKDSGFISKFEIGEFERLYGDRLVIELFYEGGITSFEVNTLPALLHELSKLHPGCRLQLASIVETNGGALITIRAEGVEQDALVSMQSQARKMQDLQVELRASDKLADRLQIEKDLLLNEIFPRLGATHLNTVNISAPSTHLAIGFDGSSPQIAHTETLDLEAIIGLVSDIKTEVANAQFKRSIDIEISEAIEKAQEALERRDSKPTYLRQALGKLQDVATRALTSEATSVLTSHLPSLLHKLEHFGKMLG